jgi:4-amino-4-deoxy-L-arabinose transferase-like glycosyltransferase
VAARSSDPFPWRTLGAGLLIYLALQALCLGLAPISGSSEAREAQVVETILRDDSWVLPLRNGVIPSKPPLYHWLAAGISIVCGGVSELSVRMTSQLAAAWCLFLVAVIAYVGAHRLRTYQSTAHPRRAALLAAGILSLTYGFYQMGCQAMVDMTFAASVLSAIACVVLGARKLESGSYAIHPGARIGFWFCCAVGILARGPVGCLLPIALTGVIGWSCFGFKQTVREFVAPTFGWLFFLVPIGWYYAAYLQGGDAFVERQIFFENLKRFSGGEHVNSEVWWFYLPSLLRTSFPWGLILVVILIRELRKGATVSYPGERGLVRWVPTLVLMVGMLLFSLSSGKRHSYLLPVLPCIALQLALEISTLIERGGGKMRHRLFRAGRALEVWITGLTLGLIAVATLGVITGLISNPFFHQSYGAVAPLISRLGPLLLMFACVVFVSIRRDLAALFASVWFLMLLVMTGVVASGAVTKAYFKGFDSIGQTWLATIAQGEKLAVFKNSFDEYFDPLLFHVHRPVRLIALEDVSQECEAHTVYAARRSWLDAHEQLFLGSIVRIATVRERLKAQQSASDRDLVFFRCSTLGSEIAKPSEPALLQDASTRNPPGHQFQMSVEAAIG